MPEHPDDISFAQAAIELKLATLSQVQECMEIQKMMREIGVEPKKLGELMVEKEILDREQCTKVLRRLVRDQRHLIPGYEILAKIGQGGMGAVYKARQLSLDRAVAIKVLSTSLAKNKDFIQRFVREARAGGKLSHENIVAGIDVGEAEGLYYIVMEYVDGETVSSIVSRLGPMDESRALGIVFQMARALEHAHANGLVHRDMKPENIMLTSAGVAKLCDLGLAKETDSDSSLTMSGTAVGTPFYISPEQARGEKDIDIRSDIYSLGITLFYMVTGSLPFLGASPAVIMTKHLTDPMPDPRERVPGLSEGLSTLVVKMAAKPREDRQQTPTELVEDIQKVLAGGMPQGARTRYIKPKGMTSVSQRAVAAPQGTASRVPVRSPERARPGAPRHETREKKSPVGLVVAVVLLVSALAIGGLVALQSGKRAPSTGDGAADAKGPSGTGAVEDVREPARPRESPLEKEAAQAFEELRRRVDVIPPDYGAILAAIEGFVVRYAGTKTCEDARALLAKKKELGEDEAREFLAEHSAKATQLAEQGLFYKAIMEFRGFPEGLKWTSAWEKEVKPRIDELENEMFERFKGDRRNALSLAEKGEFAAAIELMTSVEGYGSPEMKQEGLAFISQVELMKKQAQEEEKKLISWYEQEYFPEYSGLLTRRLFLEAAESCTKYISDESYRCLASRLEEDRDCANLGVWLEKKVIEGLRRYDGKKVSELPVSKLKEQLPEGSLDLGDDAVSVALAGMGSFKKPLKEIAASDMILFAGREIEGSDRGSGKAAMAFGLVLYFSEEERGLSRPHFEEAFEKGVGAAARYLEFLGEAIATEDTGEPEIQEKPPVEDEQEIDAKTKKLIFKLFKSKVEFKGEEIEILYRFTSKAVFEADWYKGKRIPYRPPEGVGFPGAEQWLADGLGDWETERGQGKGLVATGVYALCFWKGMFSEIVEVEVDTTILSEDTAVGLGIMDSTKDEYYMFVLDLAGEVAGKAAVTADILKFPAPPGVQAVPGVPIGTVPDGVNLKDLSRKGRLRVGVRLKDGRIEGLVNEKVVCVAEDKDYMRGSVSIMFVNPTADFEDIARRLARSRWRRGEGTPPEVLEKRGYVHSARVRGKLDPQWLDDEKEKKSQ